MLGEAYATQYKVKNEHGFLIAEFKTWNWWDGINISDFEIYKNYRGNKLSYKIINFAIDNLGVKNIAVRKDNYIAKHVYDVCGFKVVDQDKELYYMRLGGKDIE